MPATPNPLSGCPLKRLEIHGGSICNIYDAAQLERSLTATLEAQRSIAGDNHNLLLQSHLGLKRVLSIQLTDLIKSSNDKTETIDVDKLSQRICIQIRPQEQIALFHFEQSRDFNVAIYMLKKFGFRIKEGISLSYHTCTTSGFDSPSYPAPSTNGFGPRLSSITPLQSQRDLQAQSPFSFTSMLNSDVPLAQIQSSENNPGQGSLNNIQHQHINQPPPQDLSQQLTQQVVPVITHNPHLNPYQMYLGQQGNMYQPRVSSPLRNAVPVGDRSESPISPIPNSQPTFLTNSVAMGSLPTHRSISAPNPLSNSWQQPRCVDPCAQGPLNYYQQSPPGSQDTNTSPASSSQATDETDDSVPLQPSQDFRKLMPQTRSLPFVKDIKDKVAKSKSGERQVSKDISRLTNKPRKSPRSIHKNKGTSYEKSNLFVREMVFTDTLNIENSSVHSQLDLRQTSSQPTGSQADDSSTYHFSFELAELPPMLITDPTLLERVNQATSKLLDQYNADISRGCDGAACAQFYLKQIHIVRRDFWLSQLEQTD
ncbi:hypothetical protein V8C37DRAFT_379323 [Trichoderma ceciliae]